MNRQTIILGGGGIVVLAACLTMGYFLVKAVSERNEALNGRNNSREQLNSIHRAKVFPSDENIALLKKDQQNLEEWWQDATGKLSRTSLDFTRQTPLAFKETLQDTVRTLAAAPGGGAQGRMVRPDFYFGFSEYLGQSEILPPEEYVDQLAEQLAIIKAICEELYAAQIVSLTDVKREVKEEAQAGQDGAERATGTRRTRRGRGTSAAPEVAVAAPGAEYFSSQRFMFEFRARPAAFITALNNLAKMGLFCTVATVDVHRDKDLLHDFQQQKGSKKEAQAEVELAAKTHGERIKTDPELEPPLTVKLEIDVYKF